MVVKKWQLPTNVVEGRPATLHPNLEMPTARHALGRSAEASEGVNHCRCRSWHLVAAQATTLKRRGNKKQEISD
jgi:hypothetical protein